MPVLGLDTSNYTTSAAVFDGREGENIGRLLDVRPGELGLLAGAVPAVVCDGTGDRLCAGIWLSPDLSLAAQGRRGETWL